MPIDIQITPVAFVAAVALGTLFISMGIGSFGDPDKSSDYEICVDRCGLREPFLRLDRSEYYDQCKTECNDTFTPVTINICDSIRGIGGF